MRLFIIPMLFVAALGLLLVTGCNGCHTGIKGNGKVINQQRDVTGFNKISIEGIFPVEISQSGDKESLHVETDENLQRVIMVSSDGDRLVIKTAEHGNIRRSTKMKVYVNIKDLRELEFKSVGSLTSNGTLKLDSLDLSSESVGKLELDINAKYLHADLNAVGNTILKGQVNEVRINNKSVGTLEAFDLKAGTLMIHNTAVGSTEVYADSAFYIRSSAIGVLKYKGPGVVKEMKSEGIGKVAHEE